MGKRSFNIQLIQGFLKKQFNVQWNGVIKDVSTEQNRRAMVDDFKNCIVELALSKNGKEVYQQVFIKPDRFLVLNDRIACDYSPEWQEYLVTQSNYENGLTR